MAISTDSIPFCRPPTVATTTVPSTFWIACEISYSIACVTNGSKNDPFLEIRFSLDKVEPDFLEDSEIQKLISKEIDIPRLSQVRDIFVFCCFTGLSYSDMKKLTFDHIKTSFDGDS